MSRPPETSQSVDRAMELVHLLALRGPLRLADIDRAMGGPRRGLQRLLTSLEHAAVVWRDPDTKAYDLGMGLAILGSIASERTALPRLAPPHLRGIAEATGRTGMLLLRRDHDVVCAHSEVPSVGAALVLPVGRAIPLWSGAARAILAYLDREEVERVVPREKMQAELTDELATIRRQGWAMARGEVLSGALAVTVPVFDAAARPIACVGAMGYDVHDGGENWLPSVRSAAEALSDALGRQTNRGPRDDSPPAPVRR
ncbi:IclR family transcriptional regulator [Rhodococcus oxybenzonivorans]|uniref:IclR family transcriptional regulator n=1 Tax=Rhodococcus oxybenzonivorans TaxID=1990687 RepID=UPI001E38C29C|nr:IclR family transcriptional regulator [Rhodococcus oxybenzonivorans]